MTKARFVELVVKYGKGEVLTSFTETTSIDDAVESFFDGTFADPEASMQDWWNVEGVLTGEFA